jgi:hypothetical protein
MHHGCCFLLFLSSQGAVASWFILR